MRLDIKDVLMGTCIKPFWGVTDFYHFYFTTVSSIATRMGTAPPVCPIPEIQIGIPSLDKVTSDCQISIIILLFVDQPQSCLIDPSSGYPPAHP